MDEQFTTPSSIFRQIRDHDPDGWRRFEKLFAPLISSWVRRADLQDHDVKDLTQRVLEVVCRKIDEYRRTGKEASFRRWLRGITRVELSEYWRQKAREAQAIGGTEARNWLEMLSDHQWSDGEENGDFEKETAAIVRRACELVRSEFREDDWQAFLRTAIDKQPAKSVAEELGKSVASVYLAKSRILKRLREELDGLLD